MRRCMIVGVALVSAMEATLQSDDAVCMDQVEMQQSEDALSLLQRQARLTKNTASLVEEDEKMDDDADDDLEEELDMEESELEAVEWAGGYKKCYEAPRGAHSDCKLVGGGKALGEILSPQECAFEAAKIGADTFQFMGMRKYGIYKCWLKKCNSINIKFSTEGGKKQWGIWSTFCGLERVHTEVQSDCGPGQFTNFLKFPRPGNDSCANALRFAGMKSNNMNGYGPAQGAQVMRYAEVLPGVDLVVQADENYKPVNADNNGVWRRRYGRLNVHSGTDTTMIFKFVESQGQIPVRVEEFLFTVFDIDHGPRCTSRMSVNASKYASYFVSDNTELVVHTDTGGLGWPASSTFTSSSRGTGKDNPKFPSRLTDLQAARSVTFLYEKVKFFTMGFKMTAGPGGRNILFGGLSSITQDACPFEEDN